jgi:hypothetical protein
MLRALKKGRMGAKPEFLFTNLGTIQKWPILGNTGISARIVIGPALERVHATLLVAAPMPHHPTHQSTEIIPVLTHALIILPSFSKYQHIKEIGQNSPHATGYIE